MDPLELISIDPAVCHGQACIRGTRIPVSVVLDALAEGMGEAEILVGYPTLTSRASGPRPPTAPPWPATSWSCCETGDVQARRELSLDGPEPKALRLQVANSTAPGTDAR